MKKDPRAARSGQVAMGIVAVFTAILSACSDAAGPSVSAPDHSVDPAMEQALANARAVSSTIAGSFVARGILRDRPLPSVVIAAKLITSEGGTIDIPAADFELQIPRGAVSAPLTITVTALPGEAIAYDFEPHAATFAEPLRFVQHLNHTHFADLSDPSIIDQATGIAVASDSVAPQARPGVDGDLLSFRLWRFSGYMASTGRN
jgi:hypothetical protein